MRSYGLIVCCLCGFALGACFLEKEAFFADLKTALQGQEIPSSILDVGKMGKILKERGLIKTMPKEELFSSATALDFTKSLLTIELEIPVATELQVFWTEKKEQKYDIERSSSVAIASGQKDYLLTLPPLSELRLLRIDPTTKPADIRIRRIILYSAEHEIVLSPGDGLDLLKPLAGISSMHHDGDGVSFTALDADAQLELQLDDVRGPRKIEQLAFPRKRKKSLYRHVVDDGSQSFPSSQVITQEHFKENWPILSLVIDEANLYHPDTGLLANKTARGRQWERPAYCSYFDEHGKLRFASMVGMRMHGGKRMQLYSSFRLYFRKEYGQSRFSAFQPKIGFSTTTEPVKRLVVHHTAWPEGGWYFNNTLAYDIARRIGCQVPETRLALLYLNGVEQGIYFFVPHLGERLLETYFGHSDFLYYKYKSVPSHKGRVLNVRLWSVLRERGNLTMKAAGRVVDLDNLARHLFSFIFCGTSDYYQGLAVLDNSQPDKRAFWINWDMDQSFIQNVRSEKIVMTEWQQRAWRLVYMPSPPYTAQDVRPRLFSRLLNEDPAYREYVLTLYRDLLNHRLNARFVKERIAYYTNMLEYYGKKDTKYMKMLGEFMKQRPEVVRKETEKLFKLGPSLLCQVTGPADIQYDIDGYQEPAGYQGYYFKGSRITVSIAAPYQKRFSYWLVNEKKVNSPRLDLEVREDLIIEPVFQDEE